MRGNHGTPRGPFKGPDPEHDKNYPYGPKPSADSTVFASQRRGTCLVTHTPRLSDWDWALRGVGLRISGQSLHSSRTTWACLPVAPHHTSPSGLMSPAMAKPPTNRRALMVSMRMSRKSPKSTQYAVGCFFLYISRTLARSSSGTWGWRREIGTNHGEIGVRRWHHPVPRE